MIEHNLRDAFLSSGIIGIGLNVNQTIFDPALPNPTSMVMCSQTEEAEDLYETAKLLEEFMDIFKGYCSRYLNITGGYARLRKLYLAQLWRKDTPCRYIDMAEGKEFQGMIKGLSDIGHLMVEDIEKGELREFAFKEIGYII